MVVNKNLYTTPGATTQITVNLGHFAHGTAAQVWQLASTNAAQTAGAISHLADATFSADSLSFNAPMQSVTLFVIPAAAPPAVAATQVGDGSAQRSVVRSLAVTFSGQVTFDAGAFALRRADGATVNPAVAVAVVNGRTVATLTFSGANIESGSLADGRWTLTVVASKVHDAAQPTLTMAADATAAFHRYFGDRDGDGDVDGTDVNAIVPALFNPANYDPAFDFDGDADVDGTDVNAFVRRLFVPLP
jgi:hypothetical protein